ncbi:MAG: excinuclease ABC subunit UvrC [Planctomycetaceae bacterium]|jgi:excinuclease ABC subunit C|nr:excinuclease ABC subunit UvrC [Planctomycetaceae bacterium]
MDDLLKSEPDNLSDHLSNDLSDHLSNDFPVAEKVRMFPHRPGVYLMKDGAECVIYIGKAKDLRNRAGSYFHKTALEDARTAPLIPEIRDIDFIETESEVDALLLEARLIKDIQPKYNRDLKDSKTFPYLQIRTREPFPRVEITRTPKDHGVKLFGPFTNSSGLRGAILVLQKIFRFRSCTLDLRTDDERWRWFRPCLLHSIHQCSAPCNFRITAEEYRKNINRLVRFLEGKKKSLLADLHREMQDAAGQRQYELAAELRDQIHNLETLNQRGEIDTNIQPEAFMVDPRRGVLGLQKIFKLEKIPRIIEGIDIAHLGGTDMVASLVQFIDGLPFKPGYRRYKIKTVRGIDDFASMAEVVTRRFSHNEADHPPPDLLLIDGGKGQLHSVLTALSKTPLQPGFVLSLAKREEEVYVPNQTEPLKLSRHSFALRLLQYVRDEAHRFAQHYHHILRKNRFSKE